MAFPDVSTLIDDFNRASLGSDWHTGSWYGDSALTIASSTLLASSSTWGGGYYSAATYGPDTDLFFDIPAASGVFSLFARLSSGDSPSGYKLGEVNNAIDVYISRIDNGVDTRLGANFGLTLADGDKLGLSVVGSTITAYKYTGGAWSEVTSRSDSTYTGAGYLGAELNTTASRMDNMSGGTVSAAATSLPPKRRLNTLIRM